MKKKVSASVNICNSNFLYNVIQSSRSACLIFDIRASSQIEKKGTILGAVQLKPLSTLSKTTSSPDKQHIDIPSLSDQALSQGVKDKLKHLMRNYCFLIVSDQNLIPLDLEDDTTQEDVKTVPVDDLSPAALKEKINDTDAVSVADGLELYQALHTQKVRELYILADGLENFLLKYPFLSHDVVQDKNQNDLEESKTVKRIALIDILNYPNEITEQIFLGNAAQVKDKSILKTLKITHVLNTAAEVDVCQDDLNSIGVQYSKLPLKDFQDFNISEYFENAYQNISEIIEEDPRNNLLVHCARGMSRSVAIVTMYLMKKYKWSFKKAIEFIAKKRSTINLNIGFEELLENFEKNNFEFSGRQTL